MKASSPKSIALIGISTATMTLIAYFFTQDRFKTTIMASVAFISATLSQALRK